MAREEDLMKQVEELKRKLREAEEEKEEMRRGLEEEESETRRGREEPRGGEYMLRGSGAEGFASRTMGSGVHVEQQGTEHNDMRQFYFPSGYLNAHLNTRPQRFPTDPAKVPAWRHRMMLFLNSHGLGYTEKQSINPVNIISEDKTILARRHTPQMVAEHERAWTFLLEATADAPFEETMLAAQTLEQSWHVIVGWGLPTSDAEKALLVRQLETVQMELGEDPKIYFARVDKLLNTLKSVGIVKEEREIVRIIIRNLSDEYMVEKRSYPLTMPNISRFEVEETVRASYANRKYSDLGKLSVAVPAKAPPQVVANDPVHSQSVVVCAARVVGASGKVVVGLLVDGVGNSKVDADNSSGGLRGGMGSCRHMSVGRHGSNCSSSNMFIDNSSSINIFIDSSSRSDMFIDSCSSSINRISSNTFGNSSSYYSRTVPLIMHRPNGGSEGHLIVVLTLLGGTRRNRHPRPTLRWSACTSASGAEDSGIWPRSVPLHSGSKVHATAVVSMATATTTTASPTRTTTHTHMPTLLAIQVASTGGAVWVTRTHRYWDCHLVEGVLYIYDWDTRSSILP